MKRIGILGGTFNPIHIGHLTIAQLAAQKLRLDKVIFVPCFLPPHKPAKSVISAQDRMHMVKLSIRDNPLFTVSDYEINKGGRSYSIDTVKYFCKKLSPDCKIYFIIGADALEGLSNWREVQELMKIATFVAINRKGDKPFIVDKRVKFLFMPAIDISSSDIRHRLKIGESVKYLMPESVINYIKRKKLYKS